jgi:hypothetical protein
MEKCGSTFLSNAPQFRKKKTLFLEGSQGSSVCPTRKINAYMKMIEKGEATYSYVKGTCRSASLSTTI